MRLLERNSEGQFSLTKDIIDDIPPYAILSHTWGTDTQEVTFDDLLNGTGKSKAGYNKIWLCGEQANRDGLRYFWVDTCCIDKSSSAEVTEAINSMFCWYREATKCYVYLSDVSIHDDDNLNHLHQLDFQKSRWFTRGWTIQELLAPPTVEFYSSEWKYIGDKNSMERQIHQASGIPIQALRGHSLSKFTISERYSWAAKRDTTRKEDKAYCLLGIFNISMPLIYGEGEKAFTRLHDEIERNSAGCPRSIDRNLSRSIMTSSQLERRLSEIQQSILETHNAVMLQNKRSISQFSPMNCAGQVVVTEQPSYLPWRIRGGYLTSAIHIASIQTQQNPSSAEISDNSTSTDIRSKKRTRDLEVSSEREHKDRKRISDLPVAFARVSSDPMALPEPTGPFENWFPETYTMSQRLPTTSLMVTSASERNSLEQSRTNFYRIFYRKSPRNWCRLKISITIYCSSVFWAVTQLMPQEYRTRDANLTAATSLPQSLLLQIQQLLSKAEDLGDDSNLHFTLFSKNFSQECLCQVQEPDLSANIETHVSSPNIITYLDDLGCPRYLEKQVTQVAIVEPPNRFASLLNGSLVYETKFARTAPSCEFLYNIELLRCMEDIPGFVKLVGVVVDDSTTHLISYLLGFPRTNWTPFVNKLARGQLHPWRHREDWARQLVEVVGQVHAKGFVVGTLWHTPPGPPILIDAWGRLHFWYLQSKFVLGSTRSIYPPEFHHLRYITKSTSEADCPNVTRKTDIFHLGMLLWHIAEGFQQSDRGPVCMREGCDRECDKPSHIDPLTLPSLPDTVPPYYRKIVDDCRVEDPNNRPAAWSLLSRFPHTNQAKSTANEKPEPENADPESLSKAVFRSISCSRSALQRQRPSTGENGKRTHEELHGLEGLSF